MDSQTEKLLKNHRENMNNVVLTEDDKQEVYSLIYNEDMTAAEAIQYITDKKKTALIHKVNADFFNLIG
jgi:hypothetical protein|tara:strand:- start:59 stop:265 length:207 start_codon:yes stop_codon:yes gene_type:complete